MTEPLHNRAPGPPQPTAQSVRILAFALITAPLFLVVALFFVLPTDWSNDPPVPWVLGLVGTVGVGFVAAETFGFRAQPLSRVEYASTESGRVADRAALLQYQSLMFVRFAVTEAPMMVGIAVSFILDYGLWPFLITLVLGLPVMAYETFPTRRNVNRVAERLEADGVRTNLRATLGA